MADLHHQFLEEGSKIILAVPLLDQETQSDSNFYFLKMYQLPL